MDHVSYGDFCDIECRKILAYNLDTRNIELPREVLILAQIFKLKRHSAGI